jgi:hypothetical protein
MRLIRLSGIDKAVNDCQHVTAGNLSDRASRPARNKLSSNDSFGFFELARL